VRIQILADDEPAFLETSNGGVHATFGRAEHPDATVRGPAHAVLALLTGHVNLDVAAAMGVEYDGDRTALTRVLPDAVASRDAEILAHTGSDPAPD
jgi:hypothetical protein